MGCSGSSEKSPAGEWDNATSNNHVAKFIDNYWHGFHNGVDADIVAWANDEANAVTVESVSELEPVFRKKVEDSCANHNETLSLFIFQNSTGKPYEVEREKEDFIEDVKQTQKAEEDHAAREAELEKKVADGTATEEEKKEVEVDHTREALEAKMKGDASTDECKQFLTNGVWAYKPASMGLNDKGGRMFGGGWKRRYVTMISDAEGAMTLNYAEGMGQASKGTIPFKDIRTVEHMDINEGKQAKAPAKVVGFCFVVKTHNQRFNFACECQEDAEATVKALQKLIPKSEGSGDDVAEVYPHGLVKIAIAVKTKSGEDKFFFHQLQYYKREETVEEKKEEEAAAAEPAADQA